MNKSIKLNKTFYKILFLLMALTPLIGYFTLSEFKTGIYYYYGIITVLYGVYFTFIYKPKWNGYHYLILSFAIYLIIWSFFNGQFEEKGLLTTYNLTNFAILFATLFLSNTHYSDRFINRTILIFKITIIIALVVSVIQVALPTFLNAFSVWNSKNLNGLGMNDIYRVRRTSIFGFVEQNSLGLDFLPVLALVLSFMFLNRKNGVLLYIIAGGLVSLLSNTRYIMIGYVIILIMILFYKRVSVKNLTRIALGAIIITYILINTITYFGYNLGDWYYERLLSEGSIEQTTRFQAIGNFLIMFPEKPVLGIGTETNDELLRLSHSVGSARIHVGYLAFPVSWGIVGSVFLFGSWFLILSMYYKHAKIHGFWGSFFGFLIFIWANVTFPKYNFFYYGIMFTFIFDKYYLDKFYLKSNALLKVNIKNNVRKEEKLSGKPTTINLHLDK